MKLKVFPFELHNFYEFHELHKSALYLNFYQKWIPSHIICLLNLLDVKAYNLFISK